MIFDERDFTHNRYLVLLASKPIRNTAHGRVWWVRDEAFMVNTEGQILTVTSIAAWLKTADLLAAGAPRERGGFYLVPTTEGHQRLDQKLRGGTA